MFAGKKNKKQSGKSCLTTDRKSSSNTIVTGFKTSEMEGNVCTILYRREGGMRACVCIDKVAHTHAHKTLCGLG